jgi:peptidoglycan hydrolase-like protein with peptidoglycan-binding domain
MSTITTTTGRRSTATVVAVSAACLAAIAGICAVVILAFGGHTTPAATPAPPAHNVTPAANVAPNNPNHLPAAQVETIQRELGQLNYYEGPVNGVMTPQTVQAIEYLQRDAKLPQNGYFDQVTYLALQNMLQNGNNQMAG